MQKQQYAAYGFVFNHKTNTGLEDIGQHSVICVYCRKKTEIVNLINDFDNEKSRYHRDFCAFLHESTEKREQSLHSGYGLIASFFPNEDMSSYIKELSNNGWYFENAFDTENSCSSDQYLNRLACHFCWVEMELMPDSACDNIDIEIYKKLFLIKLSHRNFCKYFDRLSNLQSRENSFEDSIVYKDRAKELAQKGLYFTCIKDYFVERSGNVSAGTQSCVKESLKCAGCERRPDANTQEFTHHEDCYFNKIKSETPNGLKYRSRAQQRGLPMSVKE